MNTTHAESVSRVRDAVEALSAAVREFLRGNIAANLDDAEAVGLLAAAGDSLRASESLCVDLAGEISQRSENADVAARLTTRLGCRSTSEVLQQTTRVSSATARSILRVSEATRAPQSLAGESLPAPLPALRDAMHDGVIGVGAAASVVAAIRPPGRRFDAELVALADTAIAASARGYEFDPETGETSTEATMPASADTLRMHAQIWATVIDCDGAEPIEHAALRKRGITLGAVRDGLVELRGHLLPEGAEQLQRFFDAMGTPRDTKASRVEFRPTDELTPDEHAGLGGASGAGADDSGRWCGCSDPSRCSCAPAEIADSRTAAQKRHDALVTAVMVAAASADAPTIGGAAPTLVVMVTDDALAAESGTAFLPATAAMVPLAAAHHAGCAGTTQRISMTPNGRITHISTQRRIFTAHQRRAIALRDGGCVIPGCMTPAAWCEIHHVHEHARGGATHTDNGVMLCWFHHRYLEVSGWLIRMTAGVPEVRAPGWIDPTGQWRRSTASALRLSRRAKRVKHPPAGGVSPPRSG